MNPNITIILESQRSDIAFKYLGISLSKRILFWYWYAQS